MDSTKGKKYGLFIYIGLLTIACYALIGYVFTRTDFEGLLVLFIVLFVLYLVMCTKTFAGDYFRQLLGLSLLVRMLLFFSVPTLSDDYFRFIWDGLLTNQAINPYLEVPGAVVQLNGTALPAYMNTLKAGMNSLPYYSPYPPVLQGFFYASVLLGGHHLLADIIVLRLFGLLAECTTVFFLIKLLQLFGLPRQRVLWYTLNPLVIIELTGNLHGEVFMIFLMTASLYTLLRQYYFVAAVLLGLAVSVKLVPLIFLPVIVSYIGTRKGILFGVITMLTVVCSFLPFLNPTFIQHISESIGYYFQKFEFNASIYYLLRWVGYDVTGFNLIMVIGRILPVVALVAILGIAFYRKITTAAELLERLLFTLLVYYLCSLVVHPWYITLMVALAVFTPYRFALLWSGLILLTYSTYLQIPYREIVWLTALEYILLAAMLYWELKKNRRIIAGGLLDDAHR